MFVAAAGAAGAALLSSAPANAADIKPMATITIDVSDNCAVHPSGCSNGSINGLTLFYNSIIPGYPDASGSTATFNGNVSNYDYDTSVSEGNNYHWHYIFQKNFGNGSGQAVKNNAAAVGTCGALDNYRVYFNSKYLGHSQTFTKNTCSHDVNLDSTLKNNNASQHIA
ncbi:hypothetical protein [Streptomyces sp. CA-111067]|uniref:hypothetical protein n=1 Tax=Streptomyces sp. CA-111067 TaxID=3240046 RepID=UPI003D9770D0